MTKKIILTLIVYIGLICADFIITKGLSTNGMVYYKDGESVVAGTPSAPQSKETEPIFKEDVIYSDVRATVYHATQAQTDATPFITADNSFIDTSKVNDLRWIAVSRDLLRLKTSKYNFTGKLRLGDTIWISYDKEQVIKFAKAHKLNPDLIINKYDKVVGWWVVKDTMGDYFWEPKGGDSTMVATAKLNPNEYKIKDGIVYKKSYQRNWIDFLQHPKTGMLHHWNKSLIITKKTVVGHKAISKSG